MWTGIGAIGSFVVGILILNEPMTAMRMIAAVLIVSGLILSVVLLSVSMRSLPLGTAYTVWTGIGAIGSFVVGILILNEPMTAMRMIAAVLIVSGLILMKLSSN